MPLLLLPLTFTANAALSATTANTIMGTAPILSNNGGITVFDLDTVLGFTMPDNVTKYDKTHTGSITISTTDAFSAYKTFVTANGNPFTLPQTYYYDADDDIPDTTPVTGSVTATWYNGTTKITNLADKPSVCEGPYTLKIETTGVTVKSKYGNPIDNNYGTVSKTYNFTAGHQICNLKPAEMTVYSGLTSANSAFPPVPPNNPGGYNPAKWDYDSVTSRHKGFKATSGFPTTGFAQAKFQMVMSGGNQSLFSFNSSDTTNAPIDSSGNVTLLGKPSGSVTLTATLISDPSKQFPYTFTLSKWAIGKGQYAYKSSDSDPTTDGTFPAASMCKNNTITSVTTAADAKTYFFKRNELTNSPLNTLAQGGAITGTDRFSRDTDGVNSTFMGEWGYVYNYGGSGWASNSSYYDYWTAEAYSTARQFFVAAHGVVDAYGPTKPVVVAICRG